MAAVFQICDSVTLDCDFYDTESLINIINQDLSESGQSLVMLRDLSEFSGMLQSLATVEPSTVALTVGLYMALFLMGAGAKITTNLLKRY